MTGHRLSRLGSDRHLKEVSFAATVENGGEASVVTNAADPGGDGADLDATKVYFQPVPTAG